jgi:hypothetical protein
MRQMSLAQAGRADEPGRPPVVGVVADDSNFDGAGCSLWRATDPMYADRRLLLSDFRITRWSMSAGATGR